MTKATPPFDLVDVDRCPACGGTGPPRFSEVIDATFGFPGRWTLFECDRCASLWLNPRLSDAQLPAAYDDYYTHGTGGASNAPGGERLKPLLAMLPWHSTDRRAKIAYLDGVPPGRVLDVGCGDGRTVRALQAVGWEAVGIDPDPTSISAARRSGALDARSTSIEDLDEPTGSYDAVISVHSIEHMTEPSSFLRHAHRLLAPGGVLSVVTPNSNSWLLARQGPGWRGLEAPRHLQVLSPDGLRRLVETMGFEVLDCSTNQNGANAIARAHHRPSSPLTKLASYALGELWQAAEWARLRRDDRIGEELVLLARRIEVTDRPR